MPDFTPSAKLAQKIAPMKDYNTYICTNLIEVLKSTPKEEVDFNKLIDTL